MTRRWRKKKKGGGEPVVETARKKGGRGREREKKFWAVSKQAS